MKQHGVKQKMPSAAQKPPSAKRARVAAPDKEVRFEIFGEGSWSVHQ